MAIARYIPVEYDYEMSDRTGDKNNSQKMLPSSFSIPPSFLYFLQVAGQSFIISS